MSLTDAIQRDWKRVYFFLSISNINIIINPKSLEGGGGGQIAHSPHFFGFFAVSAIVKSFGSTVFYSLKHILMLIS